MSSSQSDLAARCASDGDIEAPPQPPPQAPPPPPPPPPAPRGGDAGAPVPLVRSPPVNPALARAQRAEETLQLQLEARPCRRLCPRRAHVRPRD